MIPLGVLAGSRYVAPSGGGGDTSAQFITASTTATGSTVRTYSAMDIGTAAANRNVVIICHARSANINSATIGGVAATLHAHFLDGVQRVAVLSAVVPTGTTADIVVTHSGNPGGVAVGVHAAYGTLAYASHATEGNGRIVSLTAPSDALVLVGLSEVVNAQSPWFMGTLENYALTSGTALEAYGGMDQPAPGPWSLELITTLTNYSNHAYMAVAFTLT